VAKGQNWDPNKKKWGWREMRRPEKAGGGGALFIRFDPKAIRTTGEGGTSPHIHPRLTDDEPAAAAGNAERKGDYGK
jgi:hypothetical protein